MHWVTGGSASQNRTGAFWVHQDCMAGATDVVTVPVTPADGWSNKGASGRYAPGIESIRIRGLTRFHQSRYFTGSVVLL